MQYLEFTYPYRPWKSKHILSKTHPIAKTFGSAIVAWIPVVFPSVSAFMTLWCAVPNGLSCRHLWVMVVFFLHIISVLITWALYRYGGDKALHWWLTISKDAVIGLGSVLIVFLQ